MNAVFIITGAEILKGVRADALIQPLCSMFSSRGIYVRQGCIIADDPHKLCATILELAPDSDIIVVTGGLGLTPDDTTYSAIKELETKKRVKVDEPVENPVGFAKGIDLSFDTTRVIFLPGVPRETLAMFPGVLKNTPVMASQASTIGVFGLRETEIASRIGELGSTCSFLPKDKEVMVIAPSESEARIRQLLGRHALDQDDLTTTVGGMLKERGLSFAAAESCTGGLIGHLITSLAGSSEFFLGSVVSYSNDAKVRILNVAGDMIVEHGAVSKEVARAMLKGVLEITGADVGVATTGIAGPSGGSEEKPVGTVWISAGTSQDHIVKDFCFPFDRLGNKMIFAKTALYLLREYIHDTDIHSSSDT
jgi:nicotinamide-nucleotide amidase